MERPSFGMTTACPTVVYFVSACLDCPACPAIFSRAHFSEVVFKSLLIRLVRVRFYTAFDQYFHDINSGLIDFDKPDHPDLFTTMN
jgi:hypothetical protein